MERGLLQKKEQMLWRRFEPQCPSPTCAGGHGYKLRRISRKPNWLGQPVWAKKKGEEILCRCSHCGLVWFQEMSKEMGFDARPVGYYDDLEHPWEFVPLKGKYRIREENSSRYWREIRRKVIRPPRWGRVD